MGDITDVAWNIILAIGAGGGFIAAASAMVIVSWLLHQDRGLVRHARNWLVIGLGMVGVALVAAWLWGTL